MGRILRCNNQVVMARCAFDSFAVLLSVNRIRSRSTNRGLVDRMGRNMCLFRVTLYTSVVSLMKISDFRYGAKFDKYNAGQDSEAAIRFDSCPTVRVLPLFTVHRSACRRQERRNMCLFRVTLYTRVDSLMKNSEFGYGAKSAV